MLAMQALWQATVSICEMLQIQMALVQSRLRQLLVVTVLRSVHGKAKYSIRMVPASMLSA